MIILSKDYRIRKLDEYNMLLEKRGVVAKIGFAGKASKNAGKEKWDILGYYSNVRDAVRKYTDEELNNSESMEDLKVRLKDLREQVKNISAL